MSWKDLIHKLLERQIIYVLISNEMDKKKTDLRWTTDISVNL